MHFDRVIYGRRCMVKNGRNWFSDHVKLHVIIFYRMEMSIMLRNGLRKIGIKELERMFGKRGIEMIPMQNV